MLDGFASILLIASSQYNSNTGSLKSRVWSLLYDLRQPIRFYLHIKHNFSVLDVWQDNPRIGGVRFCGIAITCLPGHKDFSR